MSGETSCQSSLPRASPWVLGWLTRPPAARHMEGESRSHVETLLDCDAGFLRAQVPPLLPLPAPLLFLSSMHRPEKNRTFGAGGRRTFGISLGQAGCQETASLGSEWRWGRGWEGGRVGRHSQGRRCWKDTVEWRVEDGLTLQVEEEKAAGEACLLALRLGTGAGAGKREKKGAKAQFPQKAQTQSSSPAWEFTQVSGFPRGTQCSRFLGSFISWE